MKKYIIVLLILLAAAAGILVLLAKGEGKVREFKNEAKSEEYLTPVNRESVLSGEDQDAAKKEIEKELSSKALKLSSEQASVNVEKAENAATPNKTDTLKVISKLVSFGFQTSSDRKIDTIIIHSSYDAIGKEPYDVDGLIKEYKEYGVAAHYLIDRKGGVYQLVADKNVAWHAGVAHTPDGRTDVNAFSLGIELMNTETDKYTSAQYQALSSLISELKERYKIKYVLGHREIAPGRKTDPWNFDKSILN